MLAGKHAESDAAGETPPRKRSQAIYRLLSAHYQAILAKTQAVEPAAFFEASAGLNGLESCCYTHAHAGARGSGRRAMAIGSALLP